MTIDPRPAAFVAGLEPVAVDEEVWPSGHRFELTSYFSHDLPPPHLTKWRTIDAEPTDTASDHCSTD